MDIPRIAMYIWRFPPSIGGTEQQCKILSEELTKKGAVVFVVTERIKNTRGFEIISDVRVYRAASLDLLRRLPDRIKAYFYSAGACSVSGSIYYNTRPFFKLLKYISNLLTYVLPNYYFFITSLWLLYKKRRDFDILQVHEAHWIASYGVSIGRLLGKKVIVKEATAGNLMTLNMQSLKSREKAKEADIFISISNQVTEDLILAGINETKIKKIPNGVAIDKEKWKYDFSRENTAICVSKLNQLSNKNLPDKGLDVLLEAWEILMHRFGKSIGLQILGRGDPFLYKELAAKLGIDRIVSFHGFRENVKQYLLSSSLFILPSKEEGLSNALLEAMSFGLPCIATDISGNQDLIIDDINGKLVPAGDAMALASSVAFMLDNPEKAVLMGVNARKTIESEYLISRIAGSYMELYRDLAGSKRG